MNDKSLKVTDRRMFTPDGELREEYRHLQEASSADAGSSAAGESEPAPRAAEAAPASEPADRPPPDWPPAEPMGRDEPAGAPGPVFFDLVGLLAEPATHYMREARRGSPQAAAQSLSLARLHIDLLTVLKDKTRGNLTPEEKAMLDDVVYQLRSAFVGLGG